MDIPIPLREQLYIQDVLVWLPDNRFDYFVAVVTLTNSGGETVTVEDVLGLPVEVTEPGRAAFIAAGDESNINAVIVGVTDGAPQRLTLESTDETTAKYFALVAGPSLVNGTKIHEADPFGDPYAASDVVQALAVQNIKLKFEPAEEHTTVMDP